MFEKGASRWLGAIPAERTAQQSLLRVNSAQLRAESCRGHRRRHERDDAQVHDRRYDREAAEFEGHDRQGRELRRQGDAERLREPGPETTG